MSKADGQDVIAAALARLNSVAHCRNWTLTACRVCDGQIRVVRKELLALLTAPGNSTNDWWHVAGRRPDDV